MKRHSAVIFIIALGLSCLLSTNSFAQKKKKSSGSRRTTAAPGPAPVADMRAEANQVIEQIKNVSKFLYLYGKVANGLEIADDQAKRGQVSSSVAAKNKQSKDALVANISGLKTGLENLSNSLKANPRFQVQYLKVSYAAESAAKAEQLAAAGQYDEAGKALITVIEKLSDALMSMRVL